MDIKCIHTGDLHIGMEFKNASFDMKSAQKRRMELWETFDRIINRAKEKNIDFLLIAGDLFEGEYCTVGDVKRIASKFREIKDINIVIVAGNHDILGYKSLYRLVKWPDNVYIFDNKEIEKIEFEKFNTVIWGFSWDKKEEKRNLIDGIKVEDSDKINILLIHGDILSKDSKYLPIDKKELKNSGFDYVALGHIHKPQSIDKRIKYCGSPEPLDFGETDEHGIIEGTISKQNIAMEFMPFSKRKFIIKNITIDANMSYHEIVDKIISCDKENNRSKNLYRIYLDGIKDSDINLEIEEIKENIKNEFYYIEIIDNTDLDYDLDKIKKENKDNIIGYFIEEMESKGLEKPIVKDSLYRGLKALFKEKVNL